MSSKSSFNRKLRQALEGPIDTRPKGQVIDNIQNSPPLLFPEDLSISDVSDVDSEETLSALEDCSEDEDQETNISFLLNFCLFCHI